MSYKALASSAILFFILAQCQAEAAHVFLNPPSMSASGEFTLNISVSDASNLYGFQLDLLYNTSLLSYESLTQGVFMSGGGAQTFSPQPNTSVPGKVGAIIVTRLGQVGGVSGNGTLISVSFSPRGTGIASVNISGLILADQNAARLASTSANGTYTLSVALRADVDGDGCITIDELIRFINLWKYDSTTYRMPELIETNRLWKGGIGCTP